MQAAQAPATEPFVVSMHSNVTGFASTAVTSKVAVAPGVPTGVTVTTGAVVSSPASGGCSPWPSGAETPTDDRVERVAALEADAEGVVAHQRPDGDRGVPGDRGVAAGHERGIPRAHELAAAFRVSGMATMSVPLLA